MYRNLFTLHHVIAYFRDHVGINYINIHYNNENEFFEVIFIIYIKKEKHYKRKLPREWYIYSTIWIGYSGKQSFAVVCVNVEW